MGYTAVFLCWTIGMGSMACCLAAGMPLHFLHFSFIYDINGCLDCDYSCQNDL